MAGRRKLAFLNDDWHSQAFGRRLAVAQFDFATFCEQKMAVVCNLYPQHTRCGASPLTSFASCLFFANFNCAQLKRCAKRRLFTRFVASYAVGCCCGAGRSCRVGCCRVRLLRVSTTRKKHNMKFLKWKTDVKNSQLDRRRSRTLVGRFLAC